MRTLMLTLVGLALAITPGCRMVGMGAGASQHGKQFKYENAEKIKKGDTQEQVKTLLEAEPTTTGKVGNEIHWQFTFRESTGGGMGRIVGASQSGYVTYLCNVYFDAETKLVIRTDYTKTDSGGRAISG